jgi:hypothetical protein
MFLASWRPIECKIVRPKEGKMKTKTLRSLLCPVFALLLLTGFSGSAHAAAKMANIKHKAEKFSMSLPADWEVQKDSKLGNMVIPIIAIRPAAVDDKIRENAVVVVETLPVAMTLDDYLKNNIASMPKVLNDFKPLNQGPLKNSKSPSKYLVYTHRMGSDLKVIVFFYTKGSKGYSLTCTSSPADFNKYLELFMEIGRSFVL